MSFVVRRAGAAEVLALRHAVLRPHLALEEVGFPLDSAPATAHFCAEVDGEGIVCVATVWPEPPPWPVPPAPGGRPEPEVPWRLRGMATSAAWRGRGAGSAVLVAARAHAAANGGALLWCNARLAAVPFYQRAGLVTRGRTWDEPVIGPHMAMYTRL